MKFKDVEVSGVVRYRYETQRVKKTDNKNKKTQCYKPHRNHYKIEVGYVSLLDNFFDFCYSAFWYNLKSFFTYTFDANKQYDMVQAKDLYFKNKCNTCHGDNAEKSVAGSRVLKDMSPEDIKAALVGYT